MIGASDTLVSTKLRPFHTRPNLVARPRLIAKLEPEAGRKLMLISAPAGFGKTTLLGEWAASRSDEQCVAWLSLDEADNDPARFLSYLVAALQTVEKRIGEGVLSSLRTPGSPPAAGALTGALLNELASFPEEITLVLDDYHLIDSEHIHGVVSFLLERLPSNVHLVISSRINPPLPLARLRARGQIAEINAA